MAFRSYKSQEMQNYFDHADVRSRENPFSLEAQLLNLAAVPIENLMLRISRELNQTLHVPTNIDNGGVYYGARIPKSLITSDTQDSLNSVIGYRNNTSTNLSVYDDTLPVPAGVRVDGSVAPVPLPNPLMFTVIGEGVGLTQSYATQTVNPGEFPIPNVLTLWMDQIGFTATTVKVSITGEVYPQPAWVVERTKTVENLILTKEGIATTRNRWSSIDSIIVRNLPVGIRLRGWSIPFNLPAAPDQAMPFVDPSYRDILYPRYWQISNSESLLYEMFMAAGYSGLTPCNSHAISDTLVDVTVEPNTYGVYAASGNKIYYADRREVQPNLIGTGISMEPPYGLRVDLDQAKLGPTRYAILSSVPFANSANLFQARFIMKDPSGTQWAILPDGSLAPFMKDAGWREVPTRSVTIPMLQTGDYSFTIQCQDLNGVLTYDTIPYHNSIFTPLASIDISNVVDNVQGMTFDSYGTLWVWTGEFALAMKIVYNGYVLDTASATIYTTEQWDSLTVS